MDLAMDKKSFSWLILILSFSILSPSLCLADKIYLKNGKVYEGKVIGRSDRRYLFSLDVDGEPLPLSFFLEDVAKVELGKDSVAKQIPYLKEVESTQMTVEQKKPKVYELSIYKKGQTSQAEALFSDADLVKLLNKEEYEYYKGYNEILNKNADKIVAIQDIYANLTTATKQNFADAKGSMNDLYFELNSLVVPGIFKKSHVSYLESVKATYMAFGALEQGLLDEASKQVKISEESRQRSVSEFREVILDRKNAKTAPVASVPSETQKNTAAPR
jgi:hypothetical protein